MNKNSTFQQKDDKPRGEIHPVWRGIGLLIMIILPIIAAAASMLLVDYGKSQNWPIILLLKDVIRFPQVVYQVTGISEIALYISSIPYLKALLLFFVLFLMLFSSLFAFFNALLYRMIGPPRYSRLDAPAPRVKTKRYTR